jgi:hypothetical protein
MVMTTHRLVADPGSQDLNPINGVPGPGSLAHIEVNLPVPLTLPDSAPPVAL